MKRPRDKKPSDVKQTRIAEEVAAATTSAIPVGWQTFKEFYSNEVAAAAEELFDGSGVNIQTVMMLQVADILRVRHVLRVLDVDDKKYMQLERLGSSQLRHLRLMVEKFGNNATPDGQLVAVPLGLNLPAHDDPRLFGADDIVS